MLYYLRTPGEGAFIVKKRIYPKVKIVIQNASLEVEEETMSSTYILKDGEIQTF